jgi:hypothetical protein
MNIFLQRLFLIHPWTVADLGFAMLAAQQILLGDFNAGARWQSS